MIAVSTHSSSDWALSKLYEINAILSAKFFVSDYNCWKATTSSLSQCI